MEFKALTKGMGRRVDCDIILLKDESPWAHGGFILVLTGDNGTATGTLHQPVLGFLVR